MLQLTRKKPGFGLLEAVIASGIIVILSSVTVGISHVVVTNSSGFDNKIVAANLAESGIEVAYSIRDYNLNDGKPETGWDHGFTHQQDPANPTAYQPSLNCPGPGAGSTAPVTVSSLGASCGLSIDDKIIGNSPTANLFYVNKGTDPQVINYNNTDFIREIFLGPDPTNNNIYKVRSIVFLKSDGSMLSDVSTQLTNWKDTDSTPTPRSSS